MTLSSSTDGTTVGTDGRLTVKQADRKRPGRASRLARVHLRYARDMVEELFEQDLHAKRVESLGNGVAAVLHAATLAVSMIGRHYAQLTGIAGKHGIKQVDRLLSNAGIDVEKLLHSWVQFVVAARTKIVVAMDWTDFDADDHTTLALYLVTSHGRATPLLWKTVKKSKLRGKRTALEHDMVERLQRMLRLDVEVILLADRGFGDQKLYDLLQALQWDFVIRFRENIRVERADGVAMPARAWVPGSGRAEILRGALVTDDRCPVPAVVWVRGKKMKEPWCLVTSLKDRPARESVELYGRRFTIEETFRDQKDIKFGMGLSATHIGDADRRDRMLLLAAIAQVLLTLLGAAGEEAGLDRTLKSNTEKRRQLSLFNQGVFWFGAIPNMREENLEALMTAYDRLLRNHDATSDVFSTI